MIDSMLKSNSQIPINTTSP